MLKIRMRVQQNFSHHFFSYFIFSEITNQWLQVILAMLICFFSEGQKLGNCIGRLIYSHGFVFEKTFQ